MLSAAKSRSPWRTWISTCGWLSDAVEKTWLLRVGIVVLRSISCGHDAAERLDAERQRRDVEEQDVLHLAAEHAGLDRRADGHDLVRVDAAVRLLAAEHRLDRLDRPDGMRVMPPTRTTSSMSAGVRPASLSACLTGPAVFCDQVADELLELGAGERHHQVLRAGRRRP